MSHIPPRRIPEGPQVTHTGSNIVDQNPTAKKVGDIVNKGQERVKKRPFFPLWEKNRQ